MNFYSLTERLIFKLKVLIIKKTAIFQWLSD
jgi:hypothetical protein